MQHSTLAWPRLPLEKRQSYLKNVHSIEAAQPLIELVHAPAGWGVYASLGPNYQYAIFGRDSIEFAEDILAYFPEVAREIIGVMVRLQGRIRNAITEEEPGKIHHEYRLRQYDGQAVSENALKIYKQLTFMWGEDEALGLRYYGSVDATPLFVRLVGAYVSRYGKAVLADSALHYSGERVTVRQALKLAIDWLVAKLESSSWGLLEFQRMNPHGLPYQAWKDSETAFLHLDGTPANPNDGIASVEVQGFTYDALQIGCRLIDYDEEHRTHILKLAQQLALNTIKHLWMPKEQFFAMGLDRDDNKHTRQIATLTSNAGLLLQTGLLHVLGIEAAKEYVRPIVARLMGQDDFLTSAGIRCRSLRHVDLVAFADYHGSLVTWPKDTSNIAEGMRLWGFYKEAAKLELRMAKSIILAGEPYEFFYVDSNNRAKLHYRNEYESEPRFHEFGAANVPEPMQAWSLACFLKIMLK